MRIDISRKKLDHLGYHGTKGLSRLGILTFSGHLLFSSYFAISFFKTKSQMSRKKTTKVRTNNASPFYA